MSTDAAQRDAARAEALGSFGPGRYHPGLHLAITTVSGVLLAGVGAWMAWPLRLRDLPILAGLILGVQGVEWWVHKHLLHKRSRLAPVLFDRHTPQHHRIYVTGEMAIRQWQELRLVLIPAYGIALAFVSMVPVLGALWALGLRDVAGLVALVGMLHLVSYEWLHLSFHLPEDHPVAKWKLVRALSRHHALHHDPKWMQRANFNVTSPLWDYLLGTTVPK